MVDILSDGFIRKSRFNVNLADIVHGDVNGKNALMASVVMFLLIFNVSIHSGIILLYSSIIPK